MPTKTQIPQGQSSVSGCLVRFFWMGAGNAMLLLFAFRIARDRTLAPGTSDLAFWLVAAAVIAARFIDITRLGGQTVDAEPATLAHWRRHALGLIAVAATMWLAAHALGATGWIR